MLSRETVVFSLYIDCMFLAVGYAGLMRVQSMVVCAGRTRLSFAGPTTVISETVHLDDRFRLGTVVAIHTHRPGGGDGVQLGDRRA